MISNVFLEVQYFKHNSVHIIELFVLKTDIPRHTWTYLYIPDVRRGTWTYLDILGHT